jgi:hypothetical protein
MQRLDEAPGDGQTESGADRTAGALSPREGSNIRPTISPGTPGPSSLENGAASLHSELWLSLCRAG